MVLALAGTGGTPIGVKCFCSTTNVSHATQTYRWYLMICFGTNAVLIVGAVFLFSSVNDIAGQVVLVVSSVTDIVGQDVLVVSSVADIARKVVKLQY